MANVRPQRRLGPGLFRFRPLRVSPRRSSNVSCMGARLFAITNGAILNHLPKAQPPVAPDELSASSLIRAAKACAAATKQTHASSAASRCFGVARRPRPRSRKPQRHLLPRAAHQDRAQNGTPREAPLKTLLKIGSGSPNDIGITRTSRSSSHRGGGKVNSCSTSRRDERTSEHEHLRREAWHQPANALRVEAEVRTREATPEPLLRARGREARTRPSRVRTSSSRVSRVPVSIADRPGRVRASRQHQRLASPRDAADARFVRHSELAWRSRDGGSILSCPFRSPTRPGRARASRQHERLATSPRSRRALRLPD